MTSNNSLGKIQIYTGHGKGKTTASLGVAMRVLGAGKRVAIIFFDKGGDDYSERKILDTYKGKLDYWAVGRTRRRDVDNGFDLSISAQDIKEMQKGMEFAKKAANEGTYDLLILDEINTVTALGMVEVNDVIDFLMHKPYYLELILTGRNCPDKIMEKADLITEMKEIKHYFKDGVGARVGIDV